MATHQLNYATHQLENLQLPSEETALNFQYWDVSTCKPSLEDLDHSLKSKGFGSRLEEGQSEVEMKSETFLSCHAGLSVPCVLGLCPAGSSSSVHGRGRCRAHSPTFPSLHLCHSSFSNPSITLPTSHSFSNPSIALPTSQLILQPFRCFTYVTAHSPILLSLLLHHRLFTYVTWQAAHGCDSQEKRW